MSKSIKQSHDEISKAFSELCSAFRNETPLRYVFDCIDKHPMRAAFTCAGLIVIFVAIDGAL